MIPKVYIRSSFNIDGARVAERPPPKWCDLDERGVLKPSDVCWSKDDLARLKVQQDADIAKLARKLHRSDR